MGGEDDDEGEKEDLGVVQRVVDIRPVRGAGNKLLVSQLHFYNIFLFDTFFGQISRSETQTKWQGKLD